MSGEGCKSVSWAQWFPEGAEKTVHASCVALDGVGVLICGVSGAGKSLLAFRLMTVGFSLVSDDRVVVSGGWVRAPAGSEGMFEVRQVGILKAGFVAEARLGVIVHLGEAGPRLPVPEREEGSGAVILRLEANFPDNFLKVMAAFKACSGEYGWHEGAGRV